MSKTVTLFAKIALLGSVK